ncbi:MAG: cupredoxin family copper-binding protein [Caulobacterales bacterium]
MTRLTRARVIGACVALAALIVAGVALAQGAAPTVTISNFTFDPAAITVPVGTQVTWVNGDDVPHTVVAVDHSFRSRAFDTDERYSYTFTKPGVYEYFCSLHPHMVGKVVVRRP